MDGSKKALDIGGFLGISRALLKFEERALLSKRAFVG
jgi:hypothetical protein